MIIISQTTITGFIKEYGLSFLLALGLALILFSSFVYIFRSGRVIRKEIPKVLYTGLFLLALTFLLSFMKDMPVVSLLNLKAVIPCSAVMVWYLIREERRLPK